MAWDFKREERQFEEIPEGKYRARIDSAEMAVSSKGNDMLVIKMIVNGQASRIWNYITFLDDRPELTNRLLTSFFDSFDIEDGDFNLAGYVGKAGAICVKHDDQGKARVSYFIHKKAQDELPAWEQADFTPVVDGGGDLPF